MNAIKHDESVFGGRKQAQAQLAHIMELMELEERWQDAERGDPDEGQDDSLWYDEDGNRIEDPDGDPIEDEDDVRERIEQFPLDFRVRSNWRDPFQDDADTAPGEFELLLCTGGPAVRIRGELGLHGQPENVKLQHQDWFTPWEELPLDAEQESAVLQFCEHFTSILE
ncbi:MAG: hypothetical protein ACLFU6_12065 [Candidatus Hydrogenedentota bacterium]